MTRYLLPILSLCLSASGAVINVPIGGDVQAALTAAKLGDTITLAAGGVYPGTFTLPAKGLNGSKYITITTSAPDLLPPAGQRITPGLLLPKIVAPSGSPALVTAPGATEYLIRGLEITVTPGGYAQDLVDLTSPTPGNLNTYPAYITVDQCYIHGDPNTGGKRGIALNSAYTTIQNSYLSDFKSNTQDSQAIAGWTGPGPFIIDNNYLEGGQSLIFGGAAPSVANLVPSFIEITNNYMSRPLSWKGVWNVKNLLEFKNAQNVTVSRNIFENNWTSAQNGFAILFTVRTCEAGNYPWAVVKNITFVYNLIHNSDQGINILGTDNVRSDCPAPAVAGRTSNILIQNNLFDDIGHNGWGTFLQLLSGAQSIKVDHNTVMQEGDILAADGTPANGSLRFTNNLTMFGPYGVAGTGTVGLFNTFADYVSGYTYNTNVAINSMGEFYASTKYFPAGNMFPISMDSIGFADYISGQYQLSAESMYRNAGTDGKDIGADITGVMAATAKTALGNR